MQRLQQMPLAPPLAPGGGPISAVRAWIGVLPGERLPACSSGR